MILQKQCLRNQIGMLGLVIGRGFFEDGVVRMNDTVFKKSPSASIEKRY